MAAVENAVRWATFLPPITHSNLHTATTTPSCQFQLLVLNIRSAVTQPEKPSLREVPRGIWLNWSSSLPTPALLTTSVRPVPWGLMHLHWKLSIYLEYITDPVNPLPWQFSKMCAQWKGVGSVKADWINRVFSKDKSDHVLLLYPL